MTNATILSVGDALSEVWRDAEKAESIGQCEMRMWIGMGQIAKRFGLLIAITALVNAFPPELFAQEMRMVPNWLMPPKAVIEAFKGVIPVRPVLKPPVNVVLKIGETYVSTMSATAGVVEGAVLTALHVSSTDVKHGQMSDSLMTGELYLWGHKIHPLHLGFSSINADIALFSFPAHELSPKLRLSDIDPQSQELLWWICRGGLLENEWSVGRFLGIVEGYRGHQAKSYLINPILGGTHLGCSGAPILNTRGEIVGIVLSHNDFGSVLNMFSATADQLREAYASFRKR